MAFAFAAGDMWSTALIFFPNCTQLMALAVGAVAVVTIMARSAEAKILVIG
jgi:hypothetical protein